MQNLIIRYLDIFNLREKVGNWNKINTIKVIKKILNQTNTIEE